MPTTCLRHPSYHLALQLLPPLLAFQVPQKGVGGTAPARVWDSPQRLARASALQGLGESTKYILQERRSASVPQSKQEHSTGSHMAIITPYNHTKYTSPIQELLETVSLYLHIPFCHTRCHYCDFNTYAGILPLREPYIRALLTEIELAGQLAQRAVGAPRRCRTIFFGGGTPSLLSVAQVTRLLNACRKPFPLAHHAATPLHTNPCTLT